MSEPQEQVLGTLVYAAESPNYDLMSLVLTDRQALKVPLSSMGSLVGSGAFLASWVAGAANPFAFSGIGGLVGMKQWGNLKKEVADRPIVSSDSAPVTPEMLPASVAKLPYDKVKEVKISKVMMSSDQVLFLSAGFFKTLKVVFDGRGLEDVRRLVESTPLAPKMKK